jgi:malonate transporter and related proteins
MSRLFAMSASVLFLCWAFRLTRLGRTIALVSAAVPVAATAYTMARKMGGDAELMAQLITFQNVASAIMLPLFMYIAER